MKNLKFIELLILSKLLCTLWHRIIKTKTILQQINFTGKLEENDDAKIFFITEKKLKTILSFFFRFIKHNKIIQTIEHQRILNVLNKASDSKFMTRKWNIIYDQSGRN